MAWKRASLAGLRRSSSRPVVVGIATAAVLVAFGVGRRPLALAMFAFAAFVVAAVGLEISAGSRARMAMSDDAAPGALVNLFRRNRRRYGGYLVHVGRRGAVRRRRGLVGLPARDRRAARPRARPRAGRLRVHLRQPTASLANGRMSDRRRRGARRAQGRQAHNDAAHRARLLPLARRRPVRGDRALLRRRGDQRGRPAGRGGGPVDRHPARHRRAHADHRRGQQALRASRRRAATRRGW